MTSDAQMSIILSVICLHEHHLSIWCTIKMIFAQFDISHISYIPAKPARKAAGLSVGCIELEKYKQHCFCKVQTTYLSILPDSHFNLCISASEFSLWIFSLNFLSKCSLWNFSLNFLNEFPLSEFSLVSCNLYQSINHIVGFFHYFLPSSGTK